VIHLALVVAAFLFLGGVGLVSLGMIASAFTKGMGWGCLALVGFAVLAIIILIVAA
jgi:hypothetical protein